MFASELVRFAVIIKAATHHDGIHFEASLHFPCSLIEIHVR
jgi:hypothetical protein